MKLENNNFSLTVLCVSVLHSFALLCIWEHPVFSVFWRLKCPVNLSSESKKIKLVLNLFMADPILLADTSTPDLT